MKDEGDEASREAMKIMGIAGLALIIKESTTSMREPDLEHLPGFTETSVQDAIRAVVELKKRIGKARMNVVTKAQEFVRRIYGTTGTKVQIVSSYVCQDRARLHRDAEARRQGRMCGGRALTPLVCAEAAVNGYMLLLRQALMLS